MKVTLWWSSLICVISDSNLVSECYLNHSNYSMFSCEWWPMFISHLCYFWKQFGIRKIFESLKIFNVFCEQWPLQKKYISALVTIQTCRRWNSAQTDEKFVTTCGGIKLQMDDKFISGSMHSCQYFTIRFTSYDTAR